LNINKKYWRKIMKRFLIAIISLIFINHVNVSAQENLDFESIASGAVKSVVVGGAVWLGTRMGENWAVDIAQKSITKTVSSNNPFFEWTVGSAIRGQTLLTALPIAAKLGAQNGAIVAAVITPFLCDCSVSICKSWNKVLTPLWEDKFSEENKPTTWNKIVVGSTSVLGIFVLYFTYNHYYK
jgi:hypothetical protein